MKLRKPNSKFYKWWNSYTGRRIVSATYSLGASVVILGAMFKILHLPIGNYMLGIGMTVESIIFALGVFDRPYREYDWSRIFNFKAEEDAMKLDAGNLSAALQGKPIFTSVIQPEGVTAGEYESTEINVKQANQSTGGYSQPIIINGGGGVHYTSGEPQMSNIQTSEIQAQSGSGFNFAGSLSEEDVQRLSEGIRNLSETAGSLQSLASIAGAADGLAKNIESASEIAANFANTQQKLNTSAETLAASYQNVNSEMDNVVSSTKSYSGNVEGVNKSIAAINSVYEIQLRHIQSQAESLNQQAEAIRKATEHIDGVAADMDKMKEAAAAAQMESQRYQSATRRLTKQVEDLNAVYGNMLNALS